MTSRDRAPEAAPARKGEPSFTGDLYARDIARQMERELAAIEFQKAQKVRDIWEHERHGRKDERRQAEEPEIQVGQGWPAPVHKGAGGPVRGLPPRRVARGCEGEATAVSKVYTETVVGMAVGALAIGFLIGFLFAMLGG